MSLPDWESDGPEKFYRKYIKNWTTPGLEYKVKYSSICKKLKKYVKEEKVFVTSTISTTGVISVHHSTVPVTNSSGSELTTIDLAYNKLEDHVGRKEIVVEITMKTSGNKYLKDYIIFNPSNTRKFIKRFSSSI